MIPSLKDQLSSLTQDLGDAEIVSEAGRVTLMGVAGPSEARLAEGAVSGEATANIRLTDRAGVDVSGDRGGSVQIVGGRVVLGNDSSIVASTEATDAATEAVTVAATNLIIRGGASIASNTTGDGDAGAITLTANDLTVSRGFVSSDTFGAGDGGAVNVAAESADITGRIVERNFENGRSVRVEAADISSNSFGPGDGGAVNITAQDLLIRDGGDVSSLALGQGRGGAVTVTATDLAIRDGNIRASTFGSGAGGVVTIAAVDLTVIDGFIDSGTSGRGAGGAVTITATDLRIGGPVTVISSSTRGASDAGAVTINATDLEIRGSFTSINSDTRDAGAAGQVRVDAEKIVLADGAEITSSGRFAFDELDLFSISAFPSSFSELLEDSVPISVTDVATAVDIDIEILEDIVGAGGEGFISAEGDIFMVFADLDFVVFLPSGAGPAGDLSISAGTLVVDNALIETKGAARQGGRININSTNLIDFNNAEVVANGFLPGEGDSLVTLRAPAIALNGSRVTSLTGEGTPIVGSGEVRLLGGLTIISADSEVAASSTVEVIGLQSDLGGQLVVLEGALVDAGSLLRERCAARRDIGSSSFTGVGRGGLPPSPDAPLLSDYAPQSSPRRA